MADDVGEDLSIATTGKTLVIIGLIAAFVPFAISSSESSSSIVNGKVVAFHYRDTMALLGGAVALMCGAIAAFVDRKRPKWLIVALVVLALGGLQIARGVGVFASPESGASSSTSIEINSGQ